MSRTVDCDSPPSSPTLSTSTAAKTNLPPSPPPSPKVLAPPSSLPRVLRTLHLLRAGLATDTSDLTSFLLSPSEYSLLNSRLSDQGLHGWYDDKVKFDYDFFSHVYTLRMPSAVHERFVRSAEASICDGIRKLAERLDAKEGGDALKGIFAGGSTTLELHAPGLENSSQDTVLAEEDKIVRRSPDATFYAKGEALPSLVLEVSYSQQRRDLPRLAESYIVDSRHEIRCVVGLDIVYGKKREATTVSVWRPGFEQDEDGEEVGVCVCEVNAVPFRDIDGRSCDGELRLSVRDLLPPAMLYDLPIASQQESLTISFADLASYLTAAEQQPIPAKAVKPSASGSKKFRKRKRTPSEELSDDRESSFLQMELAELEKAGKQDAEWRASRRRGTGREDVKTEVEIVERRRSKRRATGGSAG